MPAGGGAVPVAAAGGAAAPAAEEKKGKQSHLPTKIEIDLHKNDVFHITIFRLITV